MHLVYKYYHKVNFSRCECVLLKIHRPLYPFIFTILLPTAFISCSCHTTELQKSTTIRHWQYMKQILMFLQHKFSRCVPLIHN